MRITIDRIEENIAVCELDDGRMINLPSDVIPGAKEGGVYDVLITENVTAAQEQTEKARSLFDRLKKQ